MIQLANIFLILIHLFTLAYSGGDQEILQTKYRTVPSDLISKYSPSQTTIDNIRSMYFSDAKDLTDYLPINYSKRGDVDYTKFIQRGLAENSIVILPDFPILIDPKGLSFKSSSKAFFPPNSRLIVRPNDLSSYRILRLENVSNISLYFPKLVGDKEQHLGTKGQWGMGIGMKSVENILIHSPMIKNCWGDGIYVGDNGKGPSRRVSIINPVLDGNRRNGISIISAVDLKIKGGLISNTGGHNPQSGVDIEPNSNSNFLQNIAVLNLYTYNNAGHGVIISSGSIAGKAKKNIGIKIIDHTDIYSRVGLGISVSRYANRFKNYSIGGLIEITRPKYKNNTFTSIKTYKGSQHNVQLRYDDIFINHNQRQYYDFVSSFSRSLDGTIQTSD